MDTTKMMDKLDMSGTRNENVERGTVKDDYPPMTLSIGDEERLSGLAVAASRRSPEVARLLLQEIDRARLVPPEEVPANVVAMYTHVEYRDEATGAVRRVELVYPHEADIAEGRVSVLTPVGAGLLGITAGQTILWPTQDGRERRLTVLRVSRQRAFADEA
jgi:regulator of nucleoside diphosphate kinase